MHYFERVFTCVCKKTGFFFPKIDERIMAACAEYRFSHPGERGIRIGLVEGG